MDAETLGDIVGHIGVVFIIWVIASFIAHCIKKGRETNEQKPVDIPVIRTKTMNRLYKEPDKGHWGAWD